MSMGIGTNTQKPDEGELKRKMKEIACSVWYTSKGRTIPMMFKYQDEEGVIHKVTHINVQKQAEKFIVVFLFRSSAVVQWWKIRNIYFGYIIIRSRIVGR